MAGVAAHKVGAGHFHQLAALQRADGLEVLCHQPGNGGLAGARVAGEDHVHGKAGGLEACRRAALLHLQVIRQTEHILLDRPKAHKAVEFGADFIYSARVLGRQQGRQLLLGLVVQAKPYASGFAVRVTVPVSFASVCRQYSLRARNILSQHSARPAAPFSLEHWAAT